MEDGLREEVLPCYWGEKNYDIKVGRVFLTFAHLRHMLIFTPYTASLLPELKIFFVGRGISI